MCSCPAAYPRDQLRRARHRQPPQRPNRPSHTNTSTSTKLKKTWVFVARNSSHTIGASGALGRRLSVASYRADVVFNYAASSVQQPEKPATAKDTSQGKACTCNGHGGHRFGFARSCNFPGTSNQPFLPRRSSFRGEPLWLPSTLSLRHSRPKFRRVGA